MDNMSNVIIENEGMIYKIINKFKNYFELDDLYQVAVLGVIKAYKNYDSNYSTKFASYAYQYILGEVIRYVNDYRCIKVNNSIKQLYLKIVKARDILSQKLMKEPSVHELSLFLEIDESVISEALNANVIVESLDKTFSDDTEKYNLYDSIGYYDNNVENYQLTYELEKLSPIEKQIIESRYYENLSQREVGNKLGMYQVEVSRKEKKILKKLKNNIAS